MNTHKIKKILTDIFEDNIYTVAHPATYVVAESNGNPTGSLNTFLEKYPVKPAIVPFLIKTLEENWDKVILLSKMCSAAECRDFLLYESFTMRRFMNDETPVGLSKLAIKLLNIEPEESVANLCSGQIPFVRESVTYGNHNSYFASETCEEKRMIALMRSDLLEEDIVITSDNSLDLTGSFDKIFCDVPFGKKWKDYNNSYTMQTSADWLFVNNCANLLSDSGKAICIVTSGSLKNVSDKVEREKLIDSGLIECVITLPDRIYEHTAIASALLIISKNNKKTTFVDASECYTPQRRLKEISDKDIDDILSLIPNAATASIADIASKDYDLSLKNYKNNTSEKPGTVPFETLIKRITRGAQVKADELDLMVCEEPTDINLLMLSDMQEGYVNSQLPFISDMPERYLKYCAANNALILSKNGLPVRSAIVSVPDNKKILVNGNLYIIELDETQIDPYYIKAYFDSHEGQALLRNICVGVTIPNIPIEALKNLPIPLKSSKEQQKIVRQYKEKSEEILMIQNKLKEAKEDLKSIF